MAEAEDSRQQLRDHKKRNLLRERANKLKALDQVMGAVPLLDLYSKFSPVKVADLRVKEGCDAPNNEIHQMIKNLFTKIPCLSFALKQYHHQLEPNPAQTSDADTISSLFWDHIPEPCMPTSKLDSATASDKIIIGEQVRQNKFEKKLAKQLKEGSITQEQHDQRLGQGGRRSNNGKDLLLLSPDRSRRKRQQIENFASVIIGYMLERQLLCGIPRNAHNDGLPDVKKARIQENVDSINSSIRHQQRPFTIIDFGCGTGNLCLVLSAFFSSNIQVIFVDMNKESLELLQNRAQLAKLSNIQVSCLKLTCDNLDSVVDERILPDFDIGIGLHCCGSFTDMVIELCLRKGASCIVCPCCNGKMTSDSTNGFSYPRSNYLKQFVSQKDYLNVLSRQADSIETNAAVNYHAKCLVELDRALHGIASSDSNNGLLVSLGDSGRRSGTKANVDTKLSKRFSSVDLLKLDPIECSPKHHVLFFKN